MIAIAVIVTVIVVNATAVLVTAIVATAPAAARVMVVASVGRVPHVKPNSGGGAAVATSSDVDRLCAMSRPRRLCLYPCLRPVLSMWRQTLPQSILSLTTMQPHARIRCNKPWRPFTYETTSSTNMPMPGRGHCNTFTTFDVQSNNTSEFPDGSAARPTILILSNVCL